MPAATAADGSRGAVVLTAASLAVSEAAAAEGAAAASLLAQATEAATEAAPTAEDKVACAADAEASPNEDAEAAPAADIEAVPVCPWRARVGLRPGHRLSPRGRLPGRPPLGAREGQWRRVDCVGGCGTWCWTRRCGGSSRWTSLSLREVGPTCACRWCAWRLRTAADPPSPLRAGQVCVRRYLPDRQPVQTEID